MGEQLFIVVFTNYVIDKVYAFSVESALMKAKANQLIEGNKSKIDFIKNIEGKVVWGR